VKGELETARPSVFPSPLHFTVPALFDGKELPLTTAETTVKNDQTAAGVKAGRGLKP
jgi:hypothetical protein